MRFARSFHGGEMMDESSRNAIQQLSVRPITMRNHMSRDRISLVSLDVWCGEGGKERPLEATTMKNLIVLFALGLTALACGGMPEVPKVPDVNAAVPSAPGAPTGNPAEKAATPAGTSATPAPAASPTTTSTAAPATPPKK
jgi:hypothetical protein